MVKRPFLIVATVAILCGGTAYAEITVEKLRADLISSWLVTVAGEGRTRTLRILGVEQEDQETFSLDAAYGWTDGNQTTVRAEIRQTSQERMLALTTQPGSKIAANQQPDGTFTGTFTTTSGTTKGIRIEKLSEDELRKAVSALKVVTTRVDRSEVTMPGAGVTLSGILFRPPARESALPAVVVLHGWAEATVPGAPRVEGLARRLAENGYVALALSMRGWPKSGGQDDCGSKQPDDIVKAVDWLASLPGVNADRIGTIGLSQGGQVALLAAARSNQIKAVVAYYPVTDIRQWQNTTTNQGIRDYYIPRVCGFGTSRSPVNVAEKIGAAVLLVHGDRDSRVPTEQSIRMQQALQKANRTVDLQLIAGAEHGFDSNQREQAWALTARFLATYLTSSK